MTDGPATILVVDDEKNIRKTLKLVLEGEAYRVRTAESAQQALSAVAEGAIDLVLLDVKLPDKSGIEILGELRKLPDAGAPLAVIMISGHASIADAVTAVKLGATDFLEKPLDRDRVLVSIRNALKLSRLDREIKTLRADSDARHEMVGHSAAMRRLLTEIEKVAPTKGRVLIAGESGTGKELIARAVHRLSPRAKGPFIKVNCAAIPGELIESELFGYEKGAFTGATGRRKGMFELADGGTLFLDEIGDMTPSAQAKVLRALESGEVSRIGSEEAFRVDVRILTASNKDLEEEVKAGRFREDLYFRLNVVPIRSPALRERREDVPALVDAFVVQFCRENGFKPKPIAPAVLEHLCAHDWPGNVRELKNVVERMVILSGNEIGLDDLPEDLVTATRAPGQPAPRPPGQKATLREHREESERSYILEALREHNWNISRAAQALGIERTNLHKKLRAYGIQREPTGPPDAGAV